MSLLKLWSHCIFKPIDASTLIKLITIIFCFLNNLLVDADWNMFFLTCDDSMGKFIPFLKFLVMTSTLESSFRIDIFFHLFEKDV